MEDALGWHIGAGGFIGVWKYTAVIFEVRYFSADIDVELDGNHIGDVDLSGAAMFVGIAVGF